jgi:carboxypeptidase PM20D1
VRRALALLAVVAALAAGLALLDARGGGVAPEPVELATPPRLDRQRLAERLGASLRIETLSLGAGVPTDREPFLRLHELLKETFPRVHDSLQREVVGGASLLYHWPGRDPLLTPFLLMGHLDVVPVEPGTEGDWTHPPFAGVVDGAFVWGRGALDDKVSVLAALESVEYLLADGFAPQRGLFLAFGHDEEEGGNEGARAIAQLLADRGQRLQFTLDEGSGIVGKGLIPGLQRDVAIISTAEKGYLSLDLVARARGGHSSTPPRHNAIGRLARAIRRLEAQPVPDVRGGPVEGLLDHLSDHVSFGARLVLRNRWLFGPFIRRALHGEPAAAALLHTTTAPTILRAGVKDNVLPSEARATVNFRIIPGETVASVVAHVRRAVDDPEIEIEVLEGRGPTAPQGADSEGFRIVSQTVRAVFPDTATAPGLTVGGTDSKHYTDVADATLRFVPLRLGTEDLTRIHGTNEHISMDVYRDAVAFFIELVRRAASE